MNRKVHNEKIQSSHTLSTMRYDDQSANIHSAPQRSPQNPGQTDSSGTTKSSTERISNDCKKGKSNSGRVKKDDAAFGKIGTVVKINDMMDERETGAGRLLRLRPSTW